MDTINSPSPTAPNDKGSAAQIVPALRDEAGKLADKSVATGADAAAAVGKAAESAAQVLDDALPALAGYVRQAAQQTGHFADSLRDKKAEELLATAVTWSKQQPLLTMASAALLGFALSRVVKSGVAGEAPAASPAPDAGGTHEA
jgi:hypothetical protein